MLIVFIGPPGAGKGTQCERLAKQLGIPHISTGELLRQVQRQDSALGRWVARQLDAGDLVPDHLAMRIVANRLGKQDCDSGCLLDGFPRTIQQAETLDDYLRNIDRQLDLVIELNVPEEELIDRLLHRGSVGNRSDDTYETIRQRLSVYEQKTAPLLDYYRGEGLLETIDGTGTPREVYDRIIQVVLSQASDGRWC